MDYKMEELLPIVSALAQKYTGCESTSVTYEKAQTLMEAVLYCLDEYRRSCTDSLVHADISVKEQYRIGTELVWEKVQNIRKIFNELSFRFEDFGVRCLYDTVQNGIPHFLKWYDVKFCPQNTILTLDYPLLVDCGSYSGADAVYEYIKAIRLEQLFLGAFDRNFVMSVLERYDSDFREMTENICSIVLTDIVGHIAIKKPFDDIGFEAGEYAELTEIFGGKSIPDLEIAIKDFTKDMTGRFYENNSALLEYLYCDIPNIAARINTTVQHGQLSKIFVL